MKRQMTTDEIVFDVFLSHNSADKPAVEILAQKLRRKAHLKPFLDIWHLVPGEPWQEGLEQALQQSRTCAVFVGPQGISPWHREEWRAALQIRAQATNFRVIPVLLPGATMPRLEEMPLFLSRLTWVDFNTPKGIDDTEAFHRLVAAIRGQAPGDRRRARSMRKAVKEEITISVPPGPVMFASVTVDRDNRYWVEGRKNPHRDDYVYTTRPFGWKWQYEFDLLIDGTPEVDPTLDMTIMNRGTETVVLTAVGIEVVSVGLIQYSGAAMPEAVKILRGETYEVEIPELNLSEVEINRLWSEKPLKIGRTVLTILPDPLWLPQEAPFRYFLRLQHYKRLPRFALLRAIVQSDKGIASSEPILMRRWM